MAGVMNGGSCVIAAVNEGHLLTLCRHAREDFADLNPGNVGLDRFIRAATLRRGYRLDAPGIEVDGAAEQENHATVHVFSLTDRTQSLEAEKLRKRQAEH